MALDILITDERTAPRRLDRTRPYKTVLSLSKGKLYEQDNLLFRINGKQYGVEDDAPIDAVADDPQYLRLRSSDKSATGGVDYWSMHWKELKGLVEAYGGEYKSKEQAIQYLEGM